MTSALNEKDLGNAAYKNKDFDLAHQHYDKAIELDSTNITFYNNKAAVFFEEQKYSECIELCKKAVEIGREHRADFALIAKYLFKGDLIFFRAYFRIGNAYLKLGDLKEAQHYYEKSLSEHRDPEIVKKLKQLEKQIKDEEKKAYINPELSEEQKLKGNEYFKSG